MESSDAETGMVACGVGTIVWVRRRNGSWWPGKILGPVELSASHLMSPRSGTPVKLLGREDASVDWYNLEKSKRVKPFRCGEFDDCIERAEASQGMPPKKREKYARREDAILHALELEKQLLEKKYGKSGVQSIAKLLEKDTIITSAEASCDNGKHGKTKMDPSFEDDLLFPAQSGSQLNVDDKSADIRPRLRGLQDLGVGGPIPFKHNLSSFADLNGSHKNADATDGVLHALTPESRIPVGSKNFLEKRKRSQKEGNDIGETLNRRRDRRRPLVQVLKSSAKFPHVDLLQSHADGGSLHLGEEQIDMAIDAGGVGVKSLDSFDYTQTLPDQVEVLTTKCEENPVELNEENNTTGSNEDTETDSSGTESLISDTYDAMAALLDGGEEDMEFIPKAIGIGRSEAQVEDESTSDESGHPDDSGDSLPLPLQSSVTVSKWQLKGKRNSRRYTERKAVSSVSAAVWMDDSVHVGPTRGGWEDQNPESFLKGVVGGYYHDPAPVHVISSPCQFGGGTARIKSMLIDVDVGVQSGYQREHVPMISLMSKLNDKAIVGHPIPVETLEDGSSDFFLLLPAPADEESLYDVDSTLQPWRTARRTAKCRVPRPPHLSTLEEDQEEYLVDDEDGKGNRKSRKLVKRKSSTSSSNQKIRTLSSIGGTHPQQHSVDLDEGEGVMKPEPLPTAVACIPVKLVFSRLHEELVSRHQ
ncbi:hypothetical protein L1987_75038 [Smallanthus sonchifolius]|uniref:Uncharacterized protein n=1 Tax=Smallanthus sonchifolius TaxID=185202 RepID=A0ACB9A4C2_9ASTR|nr:hypothetical protein L1987_75038 [Smallanthus sonchifolius]